MLLSLFDEEGPHRGRGEVGGIWEDIKAAALRAAQPAIDVAKAPIEETAQRAAKGGALTGAVVGGLATAAAIGAVALLRRPRGDRR